MTTTPAETGPDDPDIIPPAEPDPSSAPEAAPESDPDLDDPSTTSPVDPATGA